MPPMNSCTHDKFDQKIAIIGAGPAGMSCAYFLAIEGYSPVVFEKEAAPGGMLVNGIPSFRVGKDIVKSEIDVLREMGVEFRCGVEVGKDVTIQQLREEGFKAFYVAVGLQKAAKLNIPGEELKGVLGGLDFLRAVNSGATKKLTGDVVVIGGGNAAIDVARAAKRLTGGSVSMYCLEKDEEMPTVPDEKNAGIADGVVINNSWAPKAILGEDGKVTGIELMRCVSVRDASDRFAPVYDENETITVPCANVLVAIGQRSEYGAVLAGTAAETPDGRLIAHDGVTFQTAEADVFTGGDCATGPKYTIDAIASGREGAVSIHRYVNAGQTLTIHRNLREFKELDKENITLPVEKLKKPARAEAAIDGKKVLTMCDERVTFTEEQIKAEASRCLRCGRSVVDPNKCIGCGICTTKCEFDAIHLKRNRPQNSKMIPAEDKFKAIGPYAAKRQVKIIKKLAERAYRKKKMAANEYRHRAIIWGVQSHFYMDFLVWLLNCWGIVPLTDMLSMVSTKELVTEDTPENREQAYYDMAWLTENMIMRNRTHGGYKVLLDELWEYCREFNADMVILWEHMSCKALDGMHGMFEERAREYGIHLVWVSHDLFDPRVISRQGVRDQVNNYMRTVMQEEPVDPSLENLKDDKSW